MVVWDPAVLARAGLTFGATLALFGGAPAAAQTASDGAAAATQDGGAGLDALLRAFADNPAEIAALVVGALLIGAALGWLMVGRSAPAAGGGASGGDVSAAAPPRAEAARLSRPDMTRPNSPSRRAAARAQEQGMIFRPDDRRETRPMRRSEMEEQTRRNAAEGRRLFDYFHERFGVETRSADAAIGYLEQVSAAVERLRSRLKTAETALERALDKAAEAPTGPANGGSGAPPPLRLAMDSVRVARAAMQTLQSRGDPLYATLQADTGLDDLLRRVAGLHGAHADGSAIDGGLIEEPWTHGLFRADMLLAAYFPADGVWAELRDGVSGAAAGLRGAFRDAGVVVGHVRPLTFYRKLDGEVWSDGLGRLGELEPVRAAVSRVAGQGQLVVDCDAFGFVDRARGVSGRARLIVETPRP